MVVQIYYVLRCRHAQVFAMTKGGNEYVLKVLCYGRLVSLVKKPAGVGYLNRVSLTGQIRTTSCEDHSELTGQDQVFLRESLQSQKMSYFLISSSTSSSVASPT